MSQLPHLSSPTLADQAYEAMRDGIIAGTLPRGEKVTERGLAESLNISATPVREALRRLEQDRLVERIGPRSVRIAKFDDHELREITLIEDALRALGARLAAEKATRAQLAEMHSLLDTGDALMAKATRSRTGSAARRSLSNEIHVTMRQFHDLIDLASANPTLIQMLRMVNAFDSEERWRSVQSEIEVDQATVEKRYHEHRAIFEAIAENDPEQAESLMRAHSRSSNKSRLTSRSSD
jgi:DNA-binding GntR family transcriptional regulator